MSDQQSTPANASHGNEPGFTWHPVHRGKSFAHVHNELVDEIGRDQRSYKLAMDGAEGSEHDSLTTIVDLERRWSTYEFDWAEMDPKTLADRILKFEKERERRQEMIPFADYRASGALMASDEPTASRETEGMTFGPGKVAVVAIIVAIVVLVVLIAAVQ